MFSPHFILRTGRARQQGMAFVISIFKKMFLPLGDDNRDRHTTPIVNYILLALNIVAFVFWQDMGNSIPVTFGGGITML